MKICNGLTLDKSSFEASVRGLRHVRPLAEAKDERAVVEALHAVWMAHLDPGLVAFDSAINNFEFDEYPDEGTTEHERFMGDLRKILKRGTQAEKDSRKWRTGVNLYFFNRRLRIDVPRLKKDAQAGAKSLEGLKSDLAKAASTAKKLQQGKGPEMYDVTRANKHLDAMIKGLKAAARDL
jgi:hypothetical protein